MLTYPVGHMATQGDLLEGLIAYWPYNGNTNDESGSGLNLTNTDAVLTTDRNSIADKAYQFNGTSAWMTNVDSGLNLDPFTICFWYKADSFLDHQIFIGKTTLATFSGGWAVEYNAGKISFFINHWLQVGSDRDHVQIATTDTSSWHFVCASYDLSLGSENMKLQLDNGTPVTANPNEAISYGGSPTFVIGRGSSTNFMAGKMDDFRYFNRELTLSEKTAIFNL